VAEIISIGPRLDERRHKLAEARLLAALLDASRALEEAQARGEALPWDGAEVCVYRARPPERAPVRIRPSDRW
jgi:hypothetical protein